MKKLPIKANYGQVIAKGTFFKTYFDGNPIRRGVGATFD